MDDPGAPKSSLGDSTKTIIGVLVAMTVVLVVAGLGIATVRDARNTIRRAVDLVATTTTIASPAPGGGSTTVPPGGALTPEQAKAVEEVKAQVAAIRGLAWKGPLPVTFLTKDQLSVRVRELNAEDMAENRAELAADEAVLKLLKLLGRDVDYAKTIDGLLAGGVLGYYDDETRELVVGGTASGALDPAAKATLAHELTHALTDQHFDFGARSKALDDQERTEELAALAALVEGDAELTAGLWQERHLSERERREATAGSSVDISVYTKAPPYLLASLFFPYQEGLTFVRSRHRAGGFAALDEAYRNPPTSTEHILRPDTYTAGQAWTAPALPDLARATGCGAVDSGTLGEFDMRQLLAGQISVADARTAAGGWSGDAFSAVRCGAALGLVDRWQADDAAAAGRLADALGRWARGWSGSDRAPDAEGRVTGSAGSARVVRTGERVDLVLADDLATADRLARALAAG